MVSDSVQPASVPREMFEALQRGFEVFQEQSKTLEDAYQSMQGAFGKINLELNRTNSELAASLKKQEETQVYLNSILESMGSGVVAVNVSGQVTLFNRVAAATTGYTAQEVVGKSWDEIFAKENEGGTELLSVLKTGSGSVQDEKTIRHRDGRPVPVSFRTAQLKDNNGELLGAVEVFSDVSRIKALEDEMQRTKTMAALGELSATVAHEIRNPLGAMGLWAGMLERDLEPSDPRRGTLNKIIEGLARLNKIVSNLLVYTRPVKAQLRQVNLAALLTEVVDFVQIEIERQEENVVVLKQWSADTEVYVSVDPEKLQQVVMNLCFNASQAMQNGGTLSIAIEPSDTRNNAEYASFSVTDTGCGIDPECLGKIFDPFFTTKENGTGLGLAIVKKLVEYHSGFLEVDSQVNTGTMFRVFLPSSKTQV